MAIRRPIVNISGTLQEIPTGDTVYGAGGGSSPITGVFTVNFGTPIEDGLVELSVVEPAVGASGMVKVWPSGVATSNHDPEDYVLEKVHAVVTTVTPGVGFNVLASSSSDSGATYGEYSFYYEILS